MCRPLAANAVWCRVLSWYVASKGRVPATAMPEYPESVSARVTCARKKFRTRHSKRHGADLASRRGRHRSGCIGCGSERAPVRLPAGAGFGQLPTTTRRPSMTTQNMPRLTALIPFPVSLGACTIRTKCRRLFRALRQAPAIERAARNPATGRAIMVSGFSTREYPHKSLEWLHDRARIRHRSKRQRKRRYQPSRQKTPSGFT